MTLPNVLIIGAQKSGTSWFARLLSQHPDIYFYPAEIHFFDKTYNYQKGIKWYESHFRDIEGKNWVGEKTPDYLWANGSTEEGHLPEVHRHIFHHLPDTKLIAILRNPVDRAISAVNHIIKSGRVSPLIKFDQLIYGSKNNIIETHGVIDKGMYHAQLTAFFEYFRRDQLLILIYEEDLVENPMKGLSKICEFLDIKFSERYFSGMGKRINDRRESMFFLLIRYYLPFLKPYAARIDRYLTTVKYTPSPAGRRHLKQLYLEPNQLFFEFVGREIPSWSQ